MALYKYFYHEERGEFHGYVEDLNGKIIWDVKYPDYYEDDETGELIESSTIFHDGFLAGVDDVEGLENYLKSLHILKAKDELIAYNDNDDDYADGGGLQKKYSVVFFVMNDDDYEDNEPTNIRIVEIVEAIDRDDAVEKAMQSVREKYPDIRVSEFDIYGVREVKDDEYASGGETKFKKVRTLAEAKKDPRVQTIYFEPDDYREKSGSWWLELKDGYKCRSMSCGTIHEDTLREVLDLLNNDVVKESEYARGGSTPEYETYHETLASVLDEAEEYITKKGYKFTEDRYYPDVTSGGIPYGVTQRITRDVEEVAGKQRQNTLILTIYRMDSGRYELVMFLTRTKYDLGGRVDMDTLMFNLEQIKKQYPKAKVTYYFAKDSTGTGYVIEAKENNKIVYSSYKMASGGSLETKLKKKLTETFELPLEMAVYVPSTDKANVIISKRDYANRIEEVEKYLSNLFGGYSAVGVDGGYVSDEKGLIQEDVTRVATFGSTENFESKFTALVNKVVDWCNKWGQESMGFEFEGDMFYIDKKASFKHGGVIIKK